MSTNVSPIKRRALLIGATGLIGRQLLGLLLEDPEMREVAVLTRRPTGFTSEKLTENVIDFDRLSRAEFTQTYDVAFCCLGTTMKKAGSRSAFYKVDFEYSLAFAELSKRHHVRHFVVVSAMGAHSRSLFYYSRVKGQLERALEDMNFARLSIMRPSLLLGERAESRPAERLAGKLLSQASSLFKGPLAPYVPIAGIEVARAMIQVAKSPAPEPVTIYRSNELRELAASL